MNTSTNSIKIESDYTGIKIGLDSNFSFDFEIELDYASLNGDDDFEFTKKNIESHSKHYAGHKGSTNSGNLIKINSDYGSVTFF